MSKSQRLQVFIEKIMPVKQVYYEHGGNPFKGLHRWYSRKPLSFSRASVLASLLPADISMEEFEYLLGLHPDKDGILVKSKEAIKLYKTPPSSAVIKKLEEYCEKVWGKRKPVILDAFAGGGSIPFEATRYGLNVLASDLNPVAVVTMKAAMEYPLKFGADLQQDIDKWVKFVGDEAEKRLAEFFPSQPVGANGRSPVQNYLWAHTVVCPHCESVVPLSPNWWLYKRPEKQNLHKWCAVKPIPNPEKKRVDFELIKGSKGKGTTIIYDDAVRASSSLTLSLKEGSERDAHPTNPDSIEIEYDPDTTTTISRGVGKCPNCSSVIEDDVIKSQAKSSGLGHQLYAVAYKEGLPSNGGKGGLQFRIPTDLDLDGVAKAEAYIKEKLKSFEISNIVPDVEINSGAKTDELIRYGIDRWDKLFNPRQLLTLVTYVEIINEVKSKLQIEYEPEKVEAIATYLALVLDRCVDKNARLCIWDSGRSHAQRATTQHALNLTWNYPEFSGSGELWKACADAVISDYQGLCNLFGTKSNSSTIPGLEQFVMRASSSLAPATDSSLALKKDSEQDAHTTRGNFNIQINASSADSLHHIRDRSADVLSVLPRTLIRKSYMNGFAF